MRRRARLRGLALAALCAGLVGCAAAPGAGSDTPVATPLAVSESREIELRYLALNVKSFEQTLTLADLRAIPKPILDDVWLLDMDLSGFVQNALDQIANTLPEAIPDQAGRNLQRLITMTPNNANLQGTSMEPLVGISASIGIAPQDAVRDLMQSPDADGPVIPRDIAARGLLDNLISTHPNAQFRTAPDGSQIPIAPHSIPIRLGDVVDNFARTAERFGPTVLPDGRTHPGFMSAASGFAVAEDQFSMTVLVNANALPYKGVDLSLGTTASLNSLGSQIERVFPTDDPNWLKVKGMVEQPSIGSVTLQIQESPQRFAVGTTREPLPFGNSGVWAADPWLIERLVGDMAYTQADRMEAKCVTYRTATNAVIYNACMDETGWVTFETFNNVGSPPAPAYIWDIMLEMAQVRLHDQGLAEGQANATLTLSNLPLGVDAEQLVTQIRTNIAHNPAALRELAEAANQNTRGEVDFYLYQPLVPEGSAAPTSPQDWLYFITETDIPRTETGRVRPYAYAHPGFFADPGLTQQLGALVAQDGDTTHLKMQVVEGATFYCQDDVGAVYQIRTLPKPSRGRVRLSVTRVQ